jgi:4-amino-4-deoxy-L-arabinose transferase-like glycosyltransferase
MKNTHVVILYLIILGSLLIRVYNIQQPLLEGAAGAQLDRATIARNLYIDGELLFPKGDFLPSPHLRMLEFPLYHLFVTWGYRLAGEVYEWIGRLISILFFCFSIWFLFSLTQDHFNTRVGIMAALCYAFSPLTIIYSRSFQSDSLMVSLSVITLYLFDQYLKKRSFFYFFLVTISTAALFLVKIPMLVIGLPLMVLAYSRLGSRVWLHWELWMYGMVSLLPSVGWYLYGWESMTNPLLNKMITDDWVMGSRFDLWKLFDYNFYKANYENVVGIDLTPIGFTLMVVGLLLKKRSREEIFFYSWLVSIVGMLFLMPGHSTEPYYHLPLIPPTCVFVGKAVDTLLAYEKIRESLWNNYLKRVLLFLLLSIVIFGYANSGYKIPREVVHCKDVGFFLNEISRPMDTVIVWESHQAILYYSNRKGWVLKRGGKDIKHYLKYYKTHAVSSSPIAFIEFLRSLGADYFVTSNPHALIEQKELHNYLNSHFQLVTKSDSFLVFKL